jgi:hypothetical protein
MPSHAHFLEFALTTFGRHLQQLDDKSRLVFDSPLHIVPKGLAKKALYVSLKLLPSLIRCLLIHGNYLTCLNEDDGHFNTKQRSRYIRAVFLTGTVCYDFYKMRALRQLHALLGKDLHS